MDISAYNPPAWRRYPLYRPAAALFIRTALENKGFHNYIPFLELQVNFMKIAQSIHRLVLMRQ